MQIILVDDSLHVRNSLRQMLEQLSPDTAEVMEAGCDASALRLIQKHRPELIITDAKLLLLGEAPLLEQLYGQHTYGRMIVTSSHAFILKAFCRGGMDSLLKPIGLQALEEALLESAGTSSGNRNLCLPIKSPCPCPYSPRT
ncbi:response regulator [Paenibacillus tritici]|uniref:response regulator n=1 Tax=Paenibacillus tritici TaxID=1873425 RepID=UPI001BA57D32|nr:response regulator [Paenibacillus tritici]QUL56382.1 response regulator [Paenibacillus tritici]